MATAALTITITENISLDGIPYDSTITQNLTNVENVISTQKNVLTSVGDILTVGASGDITDINYLRITNSDPTNFVTIGLKDTGGDTSYHKLEAGRSLIANNTKLDVNITGAVVAAFSDIDTITAQFDTGAGIVKLFAAKVQ